MKPWTMMMTGVAVLILCTAMPPRTMAGSVEKIKDGTQKAVSEAKKEAIRAGKAAVETGKEIKEGTVKTGTAIKDGAKAVGRDIKKAYQETKDAVTKEFSGGAREPSDK
jgi:hypothetical protein